jgi:type II secretory pathway component GspD/PulD (secretin)
MTIANGKTMIMGGMIQEKLSDDLNSIPIISDIPILGRLFGNTDQSTSRTEMLVLVTGYIVDEKGKVVWHLDDWELFGSISGIDVLESPE